MTRSRLARSLLVSLAVLPAAAALLPSFRHETDRDADPRAAATPHDPDARMRDLDRRIRAKPDDASLYLARGELFRARRDVRRALDDYDRALALAPAFDVVHVARARTLLDAGRAAEALAALERSAAKPGPRRWLRGQVLTALGDFAAAEAEFEGAIDDLSVRQPEHYLERAAVQRRQGADGVARAVAGLDAGMRELGPIVSLATVAIGLEVELGRVESANQRMEHMRAPRAAPPQPPRGAPAPSGLLARVAAPAAALPSVLIPAGATWRYLDNGTDQSTAWRDVVFPAEGSWLFGPAQLGYGDGDEATVLQWGPYPTARYPTYYFRHTFQVTNAAALLGAQMQFLRDDGAVIYLNGVEIARSNMPPSHAYTTFAPLAIGGFQESLPHAVTIDHSLLVDGANVIAAEIHQYSGGSSDISFDLLLTANGDAATLTRGPYLQRATPSSAVVRWSTSNATDSVVWLGTSPGALTVAASEPTLRGVHEVALTGLAPGTVYYYGIGSSAGMYAGGDADHSFKTSPPVGASAPTRIWAIGDSGTANADARAVRDAYLGHAAGRRTDVWLMLGDNAYNSGLDFEYQLAVFDTYPMLLRNTFVWPTLGNHDASSAESDLGTGVYYDIFTLPKAGESGGVASGTEAYYSFDHGDVHFVCLDSEATPRGPGDAMLTWLKSDLQNTQSRWVIAFWHHPPYTKGSHDSDNVLDSGGRMRDMRANALPILERLGVDLVLTGHSHSYERSYLLDGHYGPSKTLARSMKLDAGDGAEIGDGAYAKSTAGRAAHEGAVHVVAGSSGKLGGGLLNHPAMHVSLNQLGSLVIDVDGDRLDARFIDQLGVARDEFRIVKGVRQSLRRIEPRISAATGGTQHLELDAGSGYAGKSYFVLGSFGTSPGFMLGNVHVPLNPDAWFQLTAQLPNSSMFTGTAGSLDLDGRARASINLPPLHPGFVGLQVEHAFVLSDAGGFLFASNPERLTIAP